MLKNIFLLVLSFLIICVKSQLDSDNMEFQSSLKAAATQDLTENEVKYALNDLSLSDLLSLKALIDSEDHHDMDYRAESILNENIRPLDMDPAEDNSETFYDNEDNYNFEYEDSANYPNPQRQREYARENQRVKRSERKSIQQNYNDIGLEAAHIRVKRNSRF